jgi:predicted secreted protein
MNNRLGLGMTLAAMMFALAAMPGCAAGDEASDDAQNEEEVAQTEDQLGAAIISLKAGADIKLGAGSLVNVSANVNLDVQAQIAASVRAQVESCVLVDATGQILAQGSVDAQGFVRLTLTAHGRAQIKLRVSLLGLVDIGANADIRAQLRVKLKTGVTARANLHLHS